jgi:hypothetical protein
LPPNGDSRGISAADGAFLGVIRRLITVKDDPQRMSR